MRVAVAVSLLALITAVTGRAQEPMTRDIDALPALFPLFVSCDLVAQFVTPGIDENARIRLESPVSREGARRLEESRKHPVVARFPILLEPTETGSSIESAPVARFGARSDETQMHLIAIKHRDFHASVSAALPARTDPSTWVRIRALWGR